MTVSRGEIWLADLNPTQGSEQSGTRPALIFQNNIAELRCDKASRSGCVPGSPRRVISPMMARHIVLTSNEWLNYTDLKVTTTQVYINILEISYLFATNERLA